MLSSLRKNVDNEKSIRNNFIGKSSEKIVRREKFRYKLKHWVVNQVLFYQIFCCCCSKDIRLSIKI